ncbi:MAG: S41 family peptidase [Myxococcota bacterium]
MWWVFLSSCARVPAICTGTSPSERVVDRFWSVLDENYAVFPQRLPAGTTWDEVGRAACASVTPMADDPAVFSALLTMARVLDDGHIQIEGPGGLEGDGWETVWPHDGSVREAIGVARTSLDRGFSRAGDGAFRWGRRGDVGYLVVTRSDELGGSGGEGSDLRRAEDALDRVFDDLEGTRGLVVDVRFHDGGWDAVGLTTAASFVGPAAVAWTSAQRTGPEPTDLGEPYVTRIPATDEGYAGEVVVLTSGGTFSAGETFVLAMRTRDRVTTLGEPTSGHLSDLYETGLGRGFRTTWSGDLYADGEGRIHEAMGIPPDREVPFDAAGVASGTDDMLEQAFGRLR